MVWLQCGVESLGILKNLFQFWMVSKLQVALRTTKLQRFLYKVAKKVAKKAHCIT
jgi:hypothetical protein